MNVNIGNKEQWNSVFMRTMFERGFVQNIANIENMDQKLSGQNPVVAYIGFDATSSSLHVGSLLPIMALRWFQQFGHKPIILLGGGTTMIGDPSGKDQERQLMDEQTINNNIKSLKSIFEQFLRFGNGSNDAEIVNNADWIKDLNFVDFLRDTGKFFTINRMINQDFVSKRLENEQPLSFIEFTYTLLQSFDFLELKRKKNTEIQMGGSDQWGNMTSGIELVRRKDGDEVHAITFPLLTTSNGNKMGKTENGAIWLTRKDCSDHDFWQFWRNCNDSDVGRFLRLFTELPIKQIEDLENLQGAKINEAKKVLANEVTRICRGEESRKIAEDTAIETFEKGNVGSELPELNLNSSELENGKNIIDILVNIGLCASKKEAKRSINQNAVRLNNEKITDINRLITINDFNNSNAKISIGKKKHGKLLMS